MDLGFDPESNISHKFESESPSWRITETNLDK